MGIISDIFRSKAEVNMQCVTFDFHLKWLSSLTYSVSSRDLFHVKCSMVLDNF